MLPYPFIIRVAISGSAAYLIPVVGEVLDIAWAPLQTILIMALYDTVSPNLKYVSFMEEILPLTDVVPSATIGWVTEFGPQLLSGTLPFNNKQIQVTQIQHQLPPCSKSWPVSQMRKPVIP